MNTTGGHGHRHRTPYEQRKRLQKSEKKTLKCCADYPLILNSPVGSGPQSLSLEISRVLSKKGLTPRRHKEGHTRQLSNWDA